MLLGFVACSNLLPYLSMVCITLVRNVLLSVLQVVGKCHVCCTLNASWQCCPNWSSWLVHVLRCRNDIFGARDAGCFAWLWGMDVLTFDDVSKQMLHEEVDPDSEAMLSPIV